MANILIIDDDPEMCKMLADLADRMGHDAVCMYTRDSGLKEAVSHSYDIVFLDVQLPEGSGLDILPKIRETRSSPDVIIITGFGTRDGAEIAINYGAWDYIQKSASSKTLTLVFQRIIHHREELKKIQKPPVALKLNGIVGSSPLMKSCYDLIAQAAGSNVNVLLIGETGTGKELFSRAIHENSARSNSSFVVVDCTAMPETLVESELFGHVKGAFTGAESTQYGLVKQADNGTLLLDEVGELPLSIQKKFLRVFQEYRFRPVGGKDEIRSDFRLIAATNRNLDEMVKSGQFRKDLLYRLKALTIHLPPLRERPEDIIDIALFYIKGFCERNHTDTKGISPEFFEVLKSYPWPGNVRELLNILETSLIACAYKNTLLPIHLPKQMRIHTARASVKNQTQSFTESEKKDNVPASKPSFREVIDSTERKYLQDLLSQTNGNIKACSAISGLSISRFYGLMKKHNISRKF